MLPTTAKKTMNQHVLLSLKSNVVMSTSFDLWMSHNVVNTFALVINFLSDTWVLMHVNMGLFEVNEITKQSMAAELQFYWKSLVYCNG